jgi:cytochrome P450
MHYCLGANLARLEIAEALKAATRQPICGLTGPANLPIAFEPSR